MVGDALCVLLWFNIKYREGMTVGVSDGPNFGHNQMWPTLQGLSSL